MKTIATIVASFAVLAFAGCGSTVDRQGDSLKAVQGFVAAMEARNYAIACDYYATSILPAPYQFRTVKLTGQQVCALNFEFGESQSLMFFGEPVYYGFRVDPVPVVSAKHKAPLNGFVYRVKFSQGTIYVSVQRDSAGDWKIVAIK